MNFGFNLHWVNSPTIWGGFCLYVLFFVFESPARPQGVGGRL
jgi:hypothetical protein